MSIVLVPPSRALLVLRRRSFRSTLIWSSTPSWTSNSSPGATVSRCVSPTNCAPWKIRVELPEQIERFDGYSLAIRFTPERAWTI